MSLIRKCTAAAATVLACVALSYSPSASAAQTVPATFTQQGRLLDAAGVPVDGVALEFTFSLYTVDTAGTALWTETQSITPDQGYFSARIGETTPFPKTLFDGSQGPLYLGIKIGNDVEMAPRQQLTSTPFALLALEATHATAADTASGALDARIALLEARDACPDATARANFGFCIWHEGTGYTHTWVQAAASCKAKGARLCTLAEMSAAQAAGAEWCAYSWLADRDASQYGGGLQTNAWQGFPMQHVLAGCGTIGVNAGVAPMSSTLDAACCKL